MTTIHLQWRHLLDPQNKGQYEGQLPVNIGRAPGNDLVLAAEYGGVSRRHAQLIWNENCGHLLDRSLTLCPWCGTFTAEAVTQSGHYR